MKIVYHKMTFLTRQVVIVLNFYELGNKKTVGLFLSRGCEMEVTIKRHFVFTIK